MDLLARSDAPLSAEEWETLDTVVVETARKYLVGRKFIPVFGPLGAGLPLVPAPELTGFEAGAQISTAGSKFLNLAPLHKDFLLKYMDLETGQRLGLPIDYAPAAAAAYALALQEDQLVFNGCRECGLTGLLNAPGSQTVAAGDWSAAGALFADVVKAIDALGSAGFPGAYAIALSPADYALVHRPLAPAATLEIDLLRDVAQSGVYPAPALTGCGQVVVLETGSLNMDLAVGMDVQTAYLGPDNLNHPFRLMETLALRVKRPQAIVVIGGKAKRAR
ncbi:MAG TPA: family 1 encapsulin nanocompartment shell protein [Armatimonadota bacterium]|jgi:uncharacterized linocin/CFP29 family protein